MRTPERTVADTGLHLLLDLLSAFEASPYAAPFYQAYHLRLVTEVLARPLRATAAPRIAMMVTAVGAVVVDETVVTGPPIETDMIVIVDLDVTTETMKEEMIVEIAKSHDASVTTHMPMPGIARSKA